MTKERNCAKEIQNRKVLENDIAITLIALVITIIVLLILSGVTIVTLTGDNGILSQTTLSKQQTKIAEEKEKVEIAFDSAMIENLENSLTKEQFQSELDKMEGMGKTRVIVDGKDYIIHYLDSDRYYRKGANTEAKGPIQVEFLTNDYAGNITKDKNGNDLEGTSENPYQIKCIEDLVALSNMASETTFEGKVIQLKTNLSFASELSYSDYREKQYQDLNGDGVIEPIMVELTTKKGFKPIDNFKGIFDGQGYEISDLHIQREDAILGLFAKIDSATIKNLNLQGEVVSSENSPKSTYLGGIVAYVDNNSEISNCVFKGKVKATGNGGVRAGGIIGYAKNTKVIDCKNIAEVLATSSVGGIVAEATDCNIVNAHNAGNITKYLGKNGGCAGGILGAIMLGEVTISNSYNEGNITNEDPMSYSSAAGILRRIWY